MKYTLKKDIKKGNEFEFDTNPNPDLFEEVKEYDKYKRWYPGKGEEYYTENGCDVVANEDSFDKRQSALGLCFHTEDDAGEYTKFMIDWDEFQCAEWECEEIDWEDGEQNKYHIYYNNDRGVLAPSARVVCQSLPANRHLPSEESCDRAAKKFGESLMWLYR